MSGRTILVTGVTSGIGHAAALELATAGHSISLVARDPVRGKEVLGEVERANPSASPKLFVADLSSQAEIRRLAKEVLDTLPGLNVLLLNAGLHLSARETTVDGIERTWAVNHLAPFLLTHLLLDRLQANAPARIVVTASTAHRTARLDPEDLQLTHRYGGYRAYSNSKLGNVLFTYALARRLEGTGVTVNCYHPGVVRSRLFRTGGSRLFGVLGAPFMISPEKGARTAVYLAVSPAVEGRNGRYWVKCHAAESSRTSNDPLLQEKVWEASRRLCQLPA